MTAASSALSFGECGGMRRSFAVDDYESVSTFATPGDIIETAMIFCSAMFLLLVGLKFDF